MAGYVLGLDLGQAADYTAVALLERHGEASHLRYLHRFDIGTRYPAIVDAVRGMLTREPLAGQTALIVDATGVGRPVVDLLRQADLDPIAVTITGGNAVTNAGGEWGVPKRDLVGALVALFQGERLLIARGLPLAPVLVQELLNFKVKINLRTAHDTYEAWRESEHDDLVLAAALAAWWTLRRNDADAFLEAFCRPVAPRPPAPTR